MALLPSIVLRYAGPPIATLFYFPFWFIWRCRFFRVPLPFSLCMESTSYIFSFRMVFFYLVTTGWIFDIISICENSIKKTPKKLGSIRICQKQEQQTTCIYRALKRKRKIRTRLELLSIPQSGGGNIMSKRLGGIKGCKYKTSFMAFKRVPQWKEHWSTAATEGYYYINITKHQAYYC